MNRLTMLFAIGCGLAPIEPPTVDHDDTKADTDALHRQRELSWPALGCRLGRLKSRARAL